MTAADIDTLPDPASLDLLRGRCCSCSGDVSDCAAADGDNGYLQQHVLLRYLSKHSLLFEGGR